MTKYHDAAKLLISRIASDHYRLQDMIGDRNGNPVFDEEIIEAIRDLGHCIQILDDLMETNEYHLTANKLLSQVYEE